MRRLGLVALGGGVVALRIWLAVSLWEPGGSALSVDDFARLDHSLAWAASPTIAPDLVWLPLPTWVYGTVLRLVGGWLPANPMLLTALLNTFFLFIVAALSGWSAFRLFRSTAAAGAAALAMLFAPWGVWLSLSGLSEPLYFVTVAVAVTATIAWMQDRRRSSLAIAALAIAAGAACRYEGWMMMGAWALVLGWRELRPPRPKQTPGVHPLWIIVAPGLVPLAWALLNLQRTGNPFYFAEQSGQIFLRAFGPLYTLLSRAIYYPQSMVSAAPVIGIVAGAVVLVRHRDRAVVSLAAIPVLAFGILWASSLISPAVGAFNERYLFAFGVALAPVAGGLVTLAPPTGVNRRRALAAIVAASLVAVAIAAFRIPRQPEEWTVADDLLALTEALGRVADPQSPLTVYYGQDMVNERSVLKIRNGEALRVVAAGADHDPATLAQDEILIERVPARLSEIEAPPTARIGRYALYGDAAPRVQPCPGCTGWTFRDEAGAESPVTAGAYVTLEFIRNDPVAGTEAVVWIDVAATGGIALLDLRSMYGHGFNPTRIDLQVRRDGEVLFQRDIADPSRWITVPIALPAGGGTTRLEVAVVARPGIETGWGWGRASTVLIGSLTVTRP